MVLFCHCLPNRVEICKGCRRLTRSSFAQALVILYRDETAAVVWISRHRGGISYSCREFTHVTPQRTRILRVCLMFQKKHAAYNDDRRWLHHQMAL